MNNVIYESKLARLVYRISQCHTIMLFGFVFSKLSKQEMTQATRNHECTHARQWLEMTFVSCLLVAILGMFVDMNVLWVLLCMVVYYVWYLVEWCVKWCIYGDDAYYNLSFEREANLARFDSNYLENSGCFGWVKMI